jgi:regulator of sigma E protease
LANFLLAILIFWILIGQGTIGLKPVVGHVAPNSNAEKASINKGDTIVSIDNQKIDTWQDLSWELIKKNGQNKPVELTILDLNGDLKKHHLSLPHTDKNNFESDLLLQLGLSPNLPISAPIIGEVLDNGVGFLAGLKAGDLILRVNDKKIENWAQFVLIIKESPNETLSVDLDRAGDQLNVILKPDVYIDNNHAVGRIGVTYKPNQQDLDPYLVKLNHSFIKSLGMASKKTWDISIYSLKMIGKMILGQASLKAIGGPVTIATYSGKTAQLGILPWLGFLAMLSISLGVMNLLPIPVLDGGHLLYYMVEAIKGSPVSEYAMQLGQKVGFILLGLLMICAFYNDITRLITG